MSERAALRVANEDGARWRWRNHLPAGIVSDPAYAALRASVRHTLQVIADVGTVQPDGSITGTFGGRSLWTRAGISRGTFWRHIDKLTAAGLVVVLSRGGAVGPRSAANVYGIPPQVGALDHRKVAREVRCMVIDPETGKRIPQTIEPGAQSSLWADCNNSQQMQHPSLKMRRGVVSNLDGGSLKMRHYHNHIPSPSYGKNHGAFEKHRGGGRKRSPRVPHISVEHLTATPALLELHAECVRRGVIDASEYDRLFFVGAAEVALEEARRGGRGGRDPVDPVRLFVSIVQRKWRVRITPAAEARANARIKDFEYGSEDGRHHQTREGPVDGWPAPFGGPARGSRG